MIKTNTFVKALLEKELVDDIAFLSNGYDIQSEGKLTSVRFNNKGGALIWNHKTNSVVEISSGRLDDVLHRYIVQSVFGTQKAEVNGVECNNTLFTPAQILENGVVFEDTLKRKFVISGTSAEAAMTYFKEAKAVNADDCMILLNGFKKYSEDDLIESSVEEKDVELQLLKCSVNIDDFAVNPASSEMNNVGQTLVGNFLVSAADKFNAITFEEDEEKVFAFNAARRHPVKSSTVRTKNPFAYRAQIALNSSASKKATQDYLDAKYPNGLSVKAIESVMAYEAPSIFKAANVNASLNYRNVFNHFLRRGENITFRLDSNKSLFSAIEKPGVSVTKFRSIPNVEGLKNALYREGYSITELESGVTFNVSDEAVVSIVSNCQDFVPVAEKVMNEPNTVTKLVGSSCTKVLASYGIEDSKRVFNSLVRVVIN